VKITVVETRDGVALVTYAGIGPVNDMHVSKWISRVLRGRSVLVEDVRPHIRGAAERRLEWLHTCGAWAAASSSSLQRFATGDTMSK